MLLYLSFHSLFFIHFTCKYWHLILFSLLCDLTCSCLVQPNQSVEVSFSHFSSLQLMNLKKIKLYMILLFLFFLCTLTHTCPSHLHYHHQHYHHRQTLAISMLPPFHLCITFHYSLFTFSVSAFTMAAHHPMPTVIFIIITFSLAFIYEMNLKHFEYLNFLLFSHP